MANPLKTHVDPPAANNLERLTVGDKGALIGIIGLYLHDKHIDSESLWKTIDDSSDQYPLITTGRVDDILIFILSELDDRALLSIVTALSKSLLEDCSGRSTRPTG